MHKSEIQGKMIKTWSLRAGGEFSDRVIGLSGTTEHWGSIPSTTTKPQTKQQAKPTYQLLTSN